MINNENLPCALKVLALRKLFDLHLKQIDQGYYSKTKELRALDHELYTLYKSIAKEYNSELYDYSKFATYEFRL